MKRNRLIVALLCVAMALGLFTGCDKKEKPAPEPTYTMRLIVTGDKTPTIKVGETYKLKYSLTVGTKQNVVPAEVDGEAFAGGTFDNVTNVYRPERVGKAKLTLTCKYHDQTVSESVTVTVTEGSGTGAEQGGASGSTGGSAARSNYPADPEFNRLQARPNDYTTWTEFGTHDPSLIQVDGTWYAFSTDVDNTRKGYQIRKSLDGIHWNYVGAAFENPVQDVAQAVSYLGLSDDFSFWAPDIVKGFDGQFWLYYSITSAFGSAKSYIGLAKASDILGPYKHAGLVIASVSDGNQPNAIDPQYITDENGDPWLSWGSFMKGIYVLKINKETGLPVRTTTQLQAYKNGANSIAGRNADISDAFVTANKTLAQADTSSTEFYDDANKNYMAGYYIGNGRGTGMEGSVIARHGNKFYLFVSYGSLTSTYHMRCFTADHVYGPYTDVEGNQPYYAAPGNSGANNSGNKVMGSFIFNMLDETVQSNEFYAPGHNDLYTADDGTNLVAYHCRCRQVGDNMHYLYLSQYYFTKNNHLVVNPNRWAGEKLRAISQAELLGTEGDLAAELAASGYNGEYKMVKMNKHVDDQSIPSTLVRLKADGKIYKVNANGEEEIGAFTLSGNYDISFTMTAGDENGHTYEGVVSPTWLTEQSLPGLTITMIDTATGESVFLNMARR